MWGSIVAGVTGHFSGRSRSWWTGSNSLLGRLGISSDESYSVPERTSEQSGPSPLIYLAIAYFIFK